MIEKLKRAGVRMSQPAKAVLHGGGPLEGKKIVFTGELSSMSRSQAQTLVKERGGVLVESVSVRTDLVVAGESPGSKVRKAHELGVKVIDENSFLQLLGGKAATEKEEA
jgi:DNA ligase (NAD+)